MRISDWSSDVCSSDLLVAEAPPAVGLVAEHQAIFGIEQAKAAGNRFDGIAQALLGRLGAAARLDLGGLVLGHAAIAAEPPGAVVVRLAIDPPAEAPALRTVVDQPRSEEHTSELQSLMRTSYAVFCLKNKPPTNKN